MNFSLEIFNESSYCKNEIPIENTLIINVINLIK